MTYTHTQILPDSPNSSVAAQILSQQLLEHDCMLMRTTNSRWRIVSSLTGKMHTLQNLKDVWEHYRRVQKKGSLH